MVIFNEVPESGDATARIPIDNWNKNSIEQQGEIPLWNPTIFSGMPTQGSYLVSNYGAINSAILKIGNKGLYLWVFCVLGGIGTYILFIKLGLSKITSFFGTILFSITPYMFGLINASHGAKLIGMVYIPWVVASIIYTVKNCKWNNILWIGLASGIQLSSNHPQVVYYTWMLVGFYLLWNLGFALKDKSLTWNSQGKPITLVLAGLLISILMVADPYASVFEFQKHSNRGAVSVLDEKGDTESGTSWDYATQWSFHPKETISFLYPYWYGLQNFPDKTVKSAAYWGYMPFTQSTHYMGLLVVLLAVLGAVLKKPDKLDLFFWVTTIMILIVGFGSYFPVLFGPLFKLAPFFSKFRVPSMIYLLLPLTVGYLGARGLDTIMVLLQKRNNKKTLKWILIIFGGFFTVTLVLLLFRDSLVSFVQTGEGTRFNRQILGQIITERKTLFDKGLFLALIVSGSALAALWAGYNHKIKIQIVGVIFIAVTVIELWVIDNEFLHLKPQSSMENQFVATDVDRFLMADSSHYRIFPVDQFDTNRYGYFGITSIGGYRPVKLRIYQDLMDARGLNNFNILNMLNVKYLVTAQKIDHPALALDFSGSSNIYRNTAAQPKAWFVSEIISVNSQKESLSGILAPTFNPTTTAIVNEFSGDPDVRKEGNLVQVLSLSSNEIIMKANCTTNSFLVLSEIYYKPGWVAFIDGVKTEVYQTNHVLRGIQVPPGNHEIFFKYDTKLWDTTRILSRSLFIVLLIGIVFINRKPILEFVKRKK